MRHPARPVAGFNCALGAALLLHPQRAATSLGIRTVPESWVIRVLGARVLGQGLLILARPRRGTLVLATAVDGAHAVSMVAAERVLPRYRRATRTSAALAAASAVLCRLAARRSARTHFDVSTRPGGRDEAGGTA